MVVMQSDEQLVALAAAGDDVAMEALFGAYTGLMHRLSRRYFLPGASREDVLQEARIGFYKAIRDFDHDDGTPFASFAVLAIQRQLITALKASRRKKHVHHTSALSLDAPLGEDSGSEPLEAVLPSQSADDPAQRAARDALREALLQGVMDAKLSDLEAEVLLHRAQGMMYQQIADELNKPVKAIDNALQRLQAKVKRSLAERLAPFLAA
jgi:RNA polymerase sporulation-specific sigma factor